VGSEMCIRDSCGDVDTLSALLRRVLSDRSHLTKFRITAGERMKSWSPREYIAATVEAVERAVSRKNKPAPPPNDRQQS